MSWWRRRKSEVLGTIVHDGNAEHRCRPPGCHEWPAGEWKVDKTYKYPEGTVWRCPCGRAWQSSRYPPGPGLGRSASLGLWLNWYRDRDNDAPPDDSKES